MLDSNLLEIARLFIQMGGGVAWALLFTLLWRMLAIIEKVVDHDQQHCEEFKTKGGSDSEDGMGAGS